MGNDVLENWEIEFESRRLLTLLRMYENDVNTLLLSLLLSIRQADKERTGEK